MTAHDNGLVTAAPMLERVEDWAAYLNGEGEPEMHQNIHRHSRLGHPLGSDAFLSMAERLTERSLRPRKILDRKHARKSVFEADEYTVLGTPGVHCLRPERVWTMLQTPKPWAGSAFGV